jgi:hypothetical protein
MLLAGVNYDPGTAVSKSCASRIGMTAFDTTNLRLTFTAPANGCVMVRIRCTLHGATTFPTILLGLLEGSTVIARQSPLGAIPGTALATSRVTQEALFCVTGLTPGSSHTYDAAYGVEILLASTNIKYGGPNDTSGANAWGGLQFEIYDAPSLLGSVMYDPGTAVSKACSSLIAMTAFDTTNLRITFTAPASGKVLVRMRVPTHGATTFSQMLLGVLEGSTVKGRVQPIGGLKTTAVATAQLALEGQFIVSGLTPGASLSWDAAYAVQTAVALTNFKYGGPNDTTTDNAWGAFCYEIWKV